MDNTYKSNGYRDICKFALFVFLMGYVFSGSEQGAYIAAFLVLSSAIGMAYFDSRVSVATALSMGIIAVSVDSIGMPIALLIIVPYVAMIIAMYRKSMRWQTIWLVFTLFATLTTFWINRP